MRQGSQLSAELVAEVKRHGLARFLQSTRTLVALLDPEGTPVTANPAFHGVSRNRSGQITFLQMVVPNLREYAQLLLESARRDKSPATGTLEFGSEGQGLRCECLIIPLERGRSLLFAEPVNVAADPSSEVGRLDAELRDARAALATKAVELQAVLAQADEAAHTDALTFLPNRRMILSELQRQVTYAERYGTPLSLSMLDLDGFKSVNDQSGHAAGDTVLGVIARELREHIREPDEIGRYGGDELLVILPHSSAAAASEQAARLCQRVRSTSIPIGAKLIRLTLSIGIAQLNAHDNWQTLLERADRALYEAKRAGGDQWVVLES